MASVIRWTSLSRSSVVTTSPPLLNLHHTFMTRCCSLLDIQLSLLSVVCLVVVVFIRSSVGACEEGGWDSRETKNSLLHLHCYVVDIHFFCSGGRGRFTPLLMADYHWSCLTCVSCPVAVFCGQYSHNMVSRTSLDKFLFKN